MFALGAAAAAFGWTRTLKKRTGQAPRLYMEALRALVEGDDHTAFERLKATVNEDSHNLDAYIKLGDLLRRGSVVPACWLEVAAVEELCATWAELWEI